MPDRMTERMSDKNVRWDCQGTLQMYVSIYLYICHGGDHSKKVFFALLVLEHCWPIVDDVFPSFVFEDGD